MLLTLPLTLSLLLFLVHTSTGTVQAVDIVAVLPDRSTAYPNGVHNGLLLTAHRLNLTVEVLDVGNFDPETSYQVLSSLIERPASQQPRVYCIWPIDFPSRELLRVLWEKHQVPIIQMNQLPGEDSLWEWDHLLGYAGPDDALRASNAGLMMIQCLKERESELRSSNTPKQVVALGYPETYGGYHLSIAAFEASIRKDKTITLAEKLPLPWGTQPAYEAVLRLLDEMGDSLTGIYAMDDSILMGAYQALQDHPNQGNVSLVGTVCNGARQLLETNQQFGTTVQAPYLEGDLAIRTAHEYITAGNLSEPYIRFTPNPMVTAATWSDMFVEFQGQSYTADDLCTWSIFYERVAGLESVDSVDDVCQIIECSFIPQYLKITGYVLAGTNYVLAIGSALLLFWFRSKSIIVLAQPFFLGVVCLGAVIDNTSIIFMGFDESDHLGPEFLDIACATFPWLLSVGHMMTTATLVVKIYRVKQLIDSASGRRGFRKVTVTVQQVAVFILIFLSIDVVIMLAWTLYDPLKWTIQVTDTDHTGYIIKAFGQCLSSEEYTYLFPVSIVIIHLGSLIYANVLAYQTSSYHKISDSKNIAIALFNSIQLLVIVTPLLIVVEGNVATSYLIRVCFVFLNNFGVLALVVIPKVWACLRGLGDVTPDIQKITASVVARSSVVDRSWGDGNNNRSSKDQNQNKKAKRSTSRGRSQSSSNGRHPSKEEAQQKPLLPVPEANPKARNVAFSLQSEASGQPDSWKDERPVDVLRDNKNSWGGGNLSTFVANDDDTSVGNGESEMEGSGGNGAPFNPSTQQEQAPSSSPNRIHSPIVPKSSPRQPPKPRLPPSKLPEQSLRPQHMSDIHAKLAKARSKTSKK